MLHEVAQLAPSYVVFRHALLSLFGIYIYVFYSIQPVTTFVDISQVSVQESVNFVSDYRLSVLWQRVDDLKRQQQNSVDEL